MPAGSYRWEPEVSVSGPARSAGFSRGPVHPLVSRPVASVSQVAGSQLRPLAAQETKIKVKFDKTYENYKNQMP